MENKAQLLSRLETVFTRWQDLLASLSEHQLLIPLLPSTWTVKDVVAHIYSWQQASMARAVAALQDKEPDYPGWWVVNGPDPEEDVDKTNAYIYQLNRDKPWSKVYADWKNQFSQYLEVTRQVPDKDFMQPGRYAWMGKYALADSAFGSLDHHEEHLETLQAWLKEHEDIQAR